MKGQGNQGKDGIVMTLQSVFSVGGTAYRSASHSVLVIAMLRLAS